MSGPEHAEPGVHSGRVAECARDRGAQPCMVDGGDEKHAVLDGIASALQFPAWAGRNLDAVYDCLIDLSWLPEGEHVLVWARHGTLADADPAAHEAICSLLADAVEHGAPGRNLRAVLTEE